MVGEVAVVEFDVVEAKCFDVFHQASATSPIATSTSNTFRDQPGEECSGGGGGDADVEVAADGGDLMADMRIRACTTHFRETTI